VLNLYKTPVAILRLVMVGLFFTLTAQGAAALSCPSQSGGAITGVFVNAAEDICEPTTFAPGPTKDGHSIVVGATKITVDFFNNGTAYRPARRGINCIPANGSTRGQIFNPTNIIQTFASGGFDASCTLTYTDATGITVSHSFTARSLFQTGSYTAQLDGFSVATGWFERIAPTVVLSGLASTIGTTEQTVTVTFSEPVFGFGPLDLNLQNALGTSYTVVSDSVYVFGITHAVGGGDVLMEIPAGGAADIAGNLNLASNTLRATVDLTGPTVTLTGLAAAVGLTPQTVTVTFSEDVTGFTLADIDAPFMTLTNFTAVSASVYTFDLSNGRSVAVSVHIPAGGAADLAGNANAVSNTLTATADPTPPSVWITGLPASIAGPVTFDATINFSESVTGFVVGDINITGGVITAFSGSGTVYTATVAANGVDDLVMSVSANVAQDAALNGNAASATFTSESIIAELTSTNIAKFMLTRSNALLSNQPDLAGFLREQTAPQFSADITEKGGIVAFDTGSNGPIWARLNANWANDLGAESQYIFGAVGGYSKLSQNLLIGGMLQFDVMSEVDGTATTSGTGWLLGPYFAAKLPDQPLYFEGSLLYGQTSNTVSPIGTYTDRFSTERWLATLGVSGQIERGALTLTPFLDAKYTSDAQAAYVDGLGNPIAAQTIALAQAGAGLDFEWALSTATMLNGGVSGIWSYSSGNAVDPGYEGGRARLELGVLHQLSPQSNIGLGGYYDGIGIVGFESYGVDIKWVWGF